MKLLFISFLIKVVVVTAIYPKVEKIHLNDKSHGFRQKYSPSFRAQNQEETHACGWICISNAANSSNNTLSITYKENNSLFSIWKQSSNVAIIIEYSSNIIALLNGQTREVITVNTVKNEVYRLKEEYHNKNLTWNSNRTNFKTYLQNLKSLKTLFKIAEESNDKNNISQIIETILNHLDPKENNKETLSLIKEFAENLKSDLRFLYQNTNTFDIHNSLKWYMKVNSAFKILLNNVGNALKQSDHLKNLNLNIIFNSNSGIEALVEFLTEIGEHVNLYQELRTILSSPGVAINFIEKLSSGSDKGLDGLITIIVNIVKFTSGNGSIGQIISGIVNYDPNGENSTLSEIIDKFLKLVESQTKRFHNEAQFEPFIKFLKNINDNNFVFNNVNISDIIKLLRWYRPQEVIPTITKILSMFLPSKGIPHFLKFIFNLLNNTNSVGGLSRLLPGVDLSNFTNLTTNGSILQRIFQNSNFTQLIATNGGPIATLSHVPIIGSIISQISSTFGHGIDMDHFFNGSFILKEIQNFLGNGNIFGTSGIPSVVTEVVHGIEQGISNILHLIPGFGNDNGTKEEKRESVNNVNDSGDFNTWFRSKQKIVG